MRAKPFQATRLLVIECLYVFKKSKLNFLPVGELAYHLSKNELGKSKKRKEQLKSGECFYVG